MQELTGRLMSLDPEAGEGLRVVAHFDALVDAQVGIEALLRAAVMLSGCPVGYADQSRGVRIAADGRRHDHGRQPPPDACTRATADGVVWLERYGGGRHPTDAMVLERLALAVGIGGRRRRVASDLDPLAVLIDPEPTQGAQRVALARLRLRPDQLIRLWAVPDDHEPPAELPSVITGTGAARARLVLTDDPSRLGGPRRAGRGIEVPAVDAVESARTALVALRLAGDLITTVDAESLGVLVRLADVPDDHGDVAALAELIKERPWAEDTVEALINTDSLRAAAKLLGVHHATLQARVKTVQERLGYGPDTSLGAHRLAAAFLINRLRRG
ncbi:helix-turn-helix domain-containing protein [Microlunatus sp. GCM10028923]|uniref:helix-turn-helix domain-containing protein n=1 Tax=Microlunatus sp. GCM10028923 TaxID=3273400 RepID=UPI00360C7919